MSTLLQKIWRTTVALIGGAALVGSAVDIGMRVQANLDNTNTRLDTQDRQLQAIGAKADSANRGVAILSKKFSAPPVLPPPVRQQTTVVAPRPTDGVPRRTITVIRVVPPTASERAMAQRVDNLVTRVDTLQKQQTRTTIQHTAETKAFQDSLRSNRKVIATQAAQLITQRNAFEEFKRGEAAERRAESLSSFVSRKEKAQAYLFAGQCFGRAARLGYEPEATSARGKVDLQRAHQLDRNVINGETR